MLLLTARNRTPCSTSLETVAYISRQQFSLVNGHHRLVHAVEQNVPLPAVVTKNRDPEVSPEVARIEDRIPSGGKHPRITRLLDPRKVEASPLFGKNDADSWREVEHFSAGSGSPGVPEDPYQPMTNEDTLDDFQRFYTERVAPRKRSEVADDHRFEHRQVLRPVKVYRNQNDATLSDYEWEGPLPDDFDPESYDRSISWGSPT